MGRLVKTKEVVSWNKHRKIFIREGKLSNLPYIMGFVSFIITKSLVDKKDSCESLSTASKSGRF